MELLGPGSELFGRFVVQEEIGGGGQSFGYRALDKQTPAHQPWRRNVFIKQFHDLVPGSNEASALPEHFDNLRNRLGKYANYLCLPIQVGEAANSVIAVYEWLQGKTLLDWLEQDLTSAQCVRISIALAKTIRVLHEEFIAHLDLKPSNIVIEENKKTKNVYLRMIDMDAAHIQRKGLRDKVIGSQFYMSPEHCEPENFGSVSTASDIFSVGIMLAEILFKQHPFVDAEDYREAIVRERYSIPPNDYHYEVVEVITSCLSAEPEGRPSAGKILFTLNAHFDTNFEATTPGEKWPRRDTAYKRERGTSSAPSAKEGPATGSRQCVLLEGEGNAAGFQRVYYNSVLIDRNQLRGSKSSLGVGTLFRLNVGKDGCVLTLLSDAAEVLLQGMPLSKGESVRLQAAQQLQIGSVSFRLSTKCY